MTLDEISVLENLSIDELLSIFNEPNGRLRGFKTRWSSLKKYFKDLQLAVTSDSRITNHKLRICPTCGDIKAKMFPKHLKTHNLTTEDWYCFAHGIEKVIHKCKHCGKPVKFNESKYEYEEYCSVSCRSSSVMYHLNEKYGCRLSGSLTLEQVKARGYSGFDDPEYVKYLELVKSMHVKTGTKNITEANSKYGSFWKLNLTEEQKENLKIRNGWDDEQLNSFLSYRLKVHKETGRVAIKSLHKAISADGTKGWHSYPENLLAEILISLNISFTREKSVVDDKYRIDYYLPDYRIGLECDGMFKFKDSDGNLMYDQEGNLILQDHYIIRKFEIEKKHNIKIINIPSDYVFHYKENPDKLLDLIKST